MTAVQGLRWWPPGPWVWLVSRGLCLNASWPLYRRNLFVPRGTGAPLPGAKGPSSQPASQGAGPSAGPQMPQRPCWLNSSLSGDATSCMDPCDLRRLVLKPLPACRVLAVPSHVTISQTLVWTYFSRCPVLTPRAGGLGGQYIHCHLHHGLNPQRDGEKVGGREKKL